MLEPKDNGNQVLTAKLLRQDYRYHKICKSFFKFDNRHTELIVMPRLHLPYD